MADDKAKGYPKISRQNWFTLRDKFKQRVPAEVNSLYIATTLGMEEASARANVIAPLKALGIIKDDGTAADRAYDWRDDTKYREVCNAIVQEVYPPALLDLFPGPEVAVNDLTTWFMRSTKVGEQAARRYAQTYEMLMEGDPAKTDVSASKASPKPATAKKPRELKQDRQQNPKATVTEKDRSGSSADENVQRGEGQPGFRPDLHIDIQIHISPESTPEQIDKIFESMARHLKASSSDVHD